MIENSFVAHALELFEPFGPVRARAMMGGHVLFCAALPVALIADERLYLKVDGATKGAFSQAGGEPFTYAMRGKTVEMSYWSPPDAALDDAESMQPWAELALAAAARARRSTGAQRRSRPRRSGRSPGRGRG